MPYENYLSNSESLDDALSRLVRSIALEEEALAALMQAEADKTIAFVGKEHDLPTKPTSSEFIQFNQSVTKILDAILMAEWMLLKKFDSVMQFQHSTQSNELNKTYDVMVGENEFDDMDY